MSGSLSSAKAAWEAVEEGEAQPGAGGADSEPESESDLSPSDAEETSWCAHEPPRLASAGA